MNSPEPQQTGQETRPAGKFLRIGLILFIAFLAVGAVVQFVLDPPQNNELRMRGSLEVAGESDDVEIYVGDRHVGTGTASVNWDRLLGADGADPLAVSLDPNAPALGAGTGVAAEALGGPGAVIVWTAEGQTSLKPIEFLGGTFSFAWHKVLLQRGNGEFDAVSVFDGELLQETGRWRRFLIPVRLRSPGGQPYYFHASAGAIGSGSGGPVPTSVAGPELTVRLDARTGPPPDQFADQVRSAALWTPDR